MTYNTCMWEVEFTDEFEDWWLNLTQEQQEALDERVTLLAEHGPGLKRPVVGDIKTSRHPNMKELRTSKSGALRVLFASIPGVTPFFCSEERNRVSGTIGISGRFLKRMTFTTLTCKSSMMRDCSVTIEGDARHA